MSGGLGRVMIALAGALALVVSASAADWPRYGGDDLLTNDIPAADSAGISAATIGSLSERWHAQLDHGVIASPLFAQGVQVDRSVENVVYVSTTAGSVFALRARDGSVIWQRQVGSTVQTCDFSYGIASTGVIDRARNRLYVIGADGLLQALDLSTGTTVPGWPLRIVRRTDVEYVWGGLAFTGNRLYVPVASYCDDAAPDGTIADGRVVAVDVDAVRIVASLDVVKGAANLGGVWGYGGLSIDPGTGHLWTATGNAWTYDPVCDCILEDDGYAEAVLELDRDLNVIAWSRPEEIPQVEDNDFGGTPLLFQPSGCPPFAAVNAKNGYVYVWRRDNLPGGPIWSAHVGPDDLANAFIGQPSYSPELNMLFVSDARDYADDGSTRTYDAVVAFAIGNGCSLPARPTWTAPGVGRGPKTPPLVVGDVLFVPGGFYKNVFALDARSGTVLWSPSLGGAVLAPIAFAQDEVLVADMSGVVHAYGVPHPVRPAGTRWLYAL